MRQALRALSTVLIVAGLLLLADAGLTLVWKEPVSSYLAQRQQDRLSGELDRLRRQPAPGLERRALAALGDQRQRLAFLARSLRRRSAEGAALGRIRIPRIGANFVLVNGTSTDDLKKGPGLYPGQPLPGLPGTAAIAGHRTTYLAPFRHIDQLRNGDSIVVEMPYGRFQYEVQKSRIVLPTALWVLRRVGYDRLILSACAPLYSAARRIIVFARLKRVVPLGAARQGRGPGGRTLVENPPGLPS